MLWSYQKMMLGETSKLTAEFADLTFNDKAVLIPIVAVVILSGVYPKPLFELIEPSVKSILTVIGK